MDRSYLSFLVCNNSGCKGDVMIQDTPEGDAWDIDLSKGRATDTNPFSIIPIGSPDALTQNNAIYRNDVLQELNTESSYVTSSNLSGYKCFFNDDGVPFYFKTNGNITEVYRALGNYNNQTNTDQLIAEFTSTRFVKTAINLGQYDDVVPFESNSGTNGKYVLAVKAAIRGTQNLYVTVDKIDVTTGEIVQTATSQSFGSHNGFINVFFIKKNSYASASDGLNHVISEYLNGANINLYNLVYGNANVNAYGQGTFRTAYINGGTILVSGYKTAYITSANWATAWAVNATFIQGAGNQEYGNPATYVPLDSARTSIDLTIVPMGTTQAGNAVSIKKVVIDNAGAVTVTNLRTQSQNFSTDKTITYSCVPGGVSGQLVTGGTYAMFTSTAITNGITTSLTSEGAFTASYGIIPETIGTINTNSRWNYLNLFIVTKNMTAASLQMGAVSGEPGQLIYDFGDLYTETNADLFDNNAGTYNAGNAYMPCPMIFEDTINPALYIAFKNANGEMVVVTISSKINFIQARKIARNVYKINTVSCYCILDTENGILLKDESCQSRIWVSPNQLVSAAFTGKVTSDIDQSNQYSAFIQNSTSTWRQDASNVAPLFAFKIDFYVDNIYEYTQSSGNISTVTTTGQFIFDPTAGTNYVAKGETQEYPIPAYATITDNGVTLLTESALRVQDYAGYYSSNQVGFSSTFFKLFGNNYCFDGTWIYGLPVSGGLISDIDRLALANGLKYLCQSPSQAFFSSAFDSALFIFDGGRQVQKQVIMSGLTSSDIQSAVFNVSQNCLWLNIVDTTSRWFMMCDGALIDTGILATGAYDTVSNCDRNVIFTNYNNFKIAQYGRDVYQKSSVLYTTSNTIPIDIQTQYFGYKDNSSMEIIRVIFKLEINDNSPAINLEIEFLWQTQNSNGSQTKAVTVSSSDIVNGLYYLSFIPNQQYCTGASIGIERVDTNTLTTPIKIHSITMYTKRIGNAIISLNV